MNAELLEKLPPLASGGHEKPEDGACIMEAVAYVAGEPWSDHPACACPVIGAFLRSWNDNLSDDRRDALLRPLVLKLVGTKSTPETELRRSLMAADWLVRVHTPAWLRLAKLTAQAEVLESLPEITSMAQMASSRGTIEAARKDAAAARDAASDAAWSAACDAAWDAASDAARDAASDAAWSAACDAAWAAARDAAWAAARGAAWAAAGAATGASALAVAWDAARDALAPTRDALQQSALALVERMIAA
jgi:hypothetical protein